MIRVMLVDDSSFMRKLTKNMLSDDGEILIVAEARNGEEALQKITDDIDVVLLDIEMPKMTGLEVLKEWRRTNKKVPIIMFSSLTKNGAEETINALNLGAFDFIEKPNNPVLLNQKREEILSKIKSASKQIKRIPTKGSSLKQPLAIAPTQRGLTAPSPIQNIILIGCSTGGPKALKDIIPMFPADLNATILIVQHMPGGDYTRSLAETLNRASHLTVHEAHNGMKFENGNAYIAPGGYQMKINSTGHIVVIDDEPESGHAPSVDYMFREVLRKKGRYNLIPVVMTGMGGDGSKSSLLLSKTGIETIVESENTCVVFGMPKKVIEIGAKHLIKDLEDIPDAIIKKLK
ncbi:chemotaxis response regulator protein-glutamate methylesterase [[Brevibacterium] frigoritolerans]|nr:chemotaxis response regulator protein-glutamate methylesterase [Peribacillus frigoritolerans]